VHLRPECPGDGRRPHHPAEDTIRVFVTVVYEAGGEHGDHHVFGLYHSGSQIIVPHPPGGLGIGRYFRPDELETISEPP
jgi:hypothetical protein